MKKKIVSIFVMSVLVISLLAMSLVSCGGNKNSNVIVTTIYPVTALVKKVVGDKYEVKQLIKGDPHSYKMSTGDRKSIEKSALFFYISEALEENIVHPFEGNKKIEPKMVETAKGIQLIEGEEEHHHIQVLSVNKLHAGHHHEHDPHIWTSPKKLLIMLENIKNAIVAKDSANKDFYLANYNTAKTELEKIDNTYATELSKYTTAADKKEIHVTHGAFTYLCKDYNLEQHALTLTTTDPSAQAMKTMIDELIEENVKSVFYTDDKEKSFADALVTNVKKKAPSHEIVAIYLDKCVLEENNTNLFDRLNKNLQTIIDSIK